MNLNLYCPKKFSYFTFQGEMWIMNFYEKLPTDFLIAFYKEMMKNIENAVLTKNMYYELSIMISAASQRGITLDKPYDFEHVVDQEALDNFIQSTNKCTKFFRLPLVNFNLGT